MKFKDLTLSLVVLVVYALSHVSCKPEYFDEASNTSEFDGIYSTTSEDDVAIVGGDDIDIKEVPYQVAVIEFGKFQCGGSIISPDIILTAAHCVRFGAESYKIRAGSSSNDKGGQLIQVKKIAVHPNYDKISQHDSDIALFWLSEPLKFSKFVKAVPMINAGEEVPVGGMTMVTGWGATKDGGPNPKTLQMVKVPVVSLKACQATYVENTKDWIWKPPPVTSTMLCAGFPQGKKDSCQGDSGGPLVYNGKLAGVVSWGKFCADARFPGVYANVSVFRGWIDETINNFRMN